MLLPLTQFGAPGGHDIYFHTSRVAELDWLFRDGHYYAHWAPDFNYGFGYPLFNFYPSLVYYLAQIFRAFGIGILDSLNWVIVSGIWLSGIFMYLLGKEFWGRYGGAVCAVAYIYVPYRIVNLYVRGAIPEFYAMTFMPLIFWSFYKVIRTKRLIYVVIGGISYGLIIPSHNVTAVFFTICLIGYNLFLLFDDIITNGKNWKRTLQYGGYFFMTAGIGIGLTAIYWLPAMYEKQFVQISNLYTGYHDVAIHFVYVSQFFSRFWGYGGSGKGPGDGLSFQLGIEHVVCTTFFLLSVLYFISSIGEREHNLGARKKQKKAYILSLIFFACALLVKEMAVTLPLIVTVYGLSTGLKTGPFDRLRTGLTFLRRWEKIKSELWKRVKIYAPYFLVFSLYFVVRAMVVSEGHHYSSESRSFFGGYDVDLFGFFIFENIVSYFKFLAIPFVEELFSTSLVVNLFIIGIVTLVCILFSKESRFAILWIFVTLMLVYSFNIGRGVYLASVGFCLLMGMLLTFGFERAKGKHTRRKHSIQIVFRIAQILIILLLFYRYGIALKESNTWWNGVAEINEKVPLLVKALHPTFPDQSKMCLQNVPLVPNQRFHSAFQFRFPNVAFRGIYVETFEECAESEKGNLLQSTYFFHYGKDRVAHDFTYETREKVAAQQAIYVRKLFRDPSHKLSQENPQLQLELDEVSLMSSIGIVTSLANGIEVPQGTVVARGQVGGEHGYVETFEVVAGQDTAEWAIRFPDIQKIVKHKMPQAYRAWTVQQPDETIVVAQNYIKKVEFQTPFVPTTFLLEFISSSDEVSSELILDVDRIVFYGDKGSER